jgi:hypothetical protein
MNPEVIEEKIHLSEEVAKDSQGIDDKSAILEICQNDGEKQWKTDDSHKQWIGCAGDNLPEQLVDERQCCSTMKFRKMQTSLLTVIALGERASMMRCENGWKSCGCCCSFVDRICCRRACDSCSGPFDAGCSFAMVRGYRVGARETLGER